MPNLNAVFCGFFTLLFLVASVLSAVSGNYQFAFWDLVGAI
jgi:hypothetical protein